MKYIKVVVCFTHVITHVMIKAIMFQAGVDTTVVMLLCRMPIRYTTGVRLDNFDSDIETSEDLPVSQRTRRGRRNGNTANPSQKVLRFGISLNASVFTYLAIVTTEMYLCM